MKERRRTYAATEGGADAEASQDSAKRAAGEGLAEAAV
jgi:hypothetical protein